MVRPIRDWLYARMEAPDEKVGGIYLPGGVDKLSITRATVLAVGPGIEIAKTGAKTKMQIKVGDVIIFNYYQAIMYQPDYQTTGNILIQEASVLAVLES